MSRTRPQKSSGPSALDAARNELFSHIHRCGVMRAAREHQVEWMKDTIDFLGERYPALSPRERKELETIGLRFCSPVIANAGDAASAEPEAPAAQESAAA